jgi:hypothetical protein
MIGIPAKHWVAYCNISDIPDDDQMISYLMAGTGRLFYSQYHSSLVGPIPFQNNTSSSIYVAQTFPQCLQTKEDIVLTNQVFLFCEKNYR